MGKKKMIRKLIMYSEQKYHSSLYIYIYIYRYIFYHSTVLLFSVHLYVPSCTHVHIPAYREMSTLLPTSTTVHEAENRIASQQHHRRDAGTLFVLKSKGSNYLHSFIPFLTLFPQLISCFVFIMSSCNQY